ncbi:MAG TPA: glycoside hydrolase family 3 N-terminal domain-containing protein [Terriglobales bacterium]
MLRKLALSALLAACLVPFAAAKDKEKFQASDPVRLDREGDKWAQKTLKKMSLEQKIGQLIMIWCRAEFLNVKDPEYIRMRDTMQKYHIGGFGMTVRVDGPFLLRNQPYEAAMLLNQLQRESELPLMFAADFERGLSMRLHGTTVFPHAMAFGADGSLADAEAFGRINAKEARAIGVQWNWFPDADVNSNPANPIINTRSFGEDPKQVGALVSAYIKGAHEGGMLTTAKHYPGHGDTATDSHLGLAAVEGDINRLDSIELPPFQDAINAGVDAIMVAHVTVKALEPDPKRVATTSSAVVTDLLKKKMGFQGLVVTDALDMNGLMRIYAGTGNPSGAAAVAALKAGNDMILIPGDIGGTYNGMLNAVKSGEIPLSQIDESVLKVLRAKASVGLNRARLVDVDNMKEVIATPEDIATGQRIAEAAVTLVRDNGDLLPLKRQPRGTPEAANPYLRVDQSRNRTVAVIFSDDVRSENGRVFERELRQRVPEARIFFVDPRIAGGMTEQIMQAVGEAQAVIVPVYAIPSAGRVIALQDATTNLMQRILQAAPGRTVVIALGNPYIARDFPAVQNYLCTFSNATVSELAAVKALFGEIAIRGKLPVTIPQVAQRGTGIERGAQTAQQGRAKDASSKTAAAP